MDHRVNIAVASPSDVKPEREAVRKVFNLWNETNTGSFLHPKMWEFSAVPALGDHPQHLLNRKIIDESELLIAVFWSKLGTPTPTASSGTVEEIREFIKIKGPLRVMLYFCTRDLPHDTSPEELIRLRDFKHSMRDQGLYQEFKTTEQFESDLYRHLDVKIDELFNGRLPLPVQTGAPAAKKSEKPLPADKRLHQLIDFGQTPEAIAAQFAKRMDEFDAISGVSNDKFYALGAHVYESAAMSLDRCLANMRGMPSDGNRLVFERISGRLKHLAVNIPDGKADFREYWARGRELSNELSAQVKLMNKWRS